MCSEKIKLNLQNHEIAEKVHEDIYDCLERVLGDKIIEKLNDKRHNRYSRVDMSSYDDILADKIANDIFEYLKYCN